MKNREEDPLNALVRRFQLPSRPSVLVEIQQLMQRGHASAEDYAYCIAKDVALSALLLKIVNSPLYGLRGKVLDIKQAVLLVGERRIEILATVAGLRQAAGTSCCISLERFWDNAMETAQMARMLCEYLSQDSGGLAEEAFSFALFRDCGIPVLVARYASYEAVLREANACPDRVFTDIEDAACGTNHATIGYFLTRSWHLPEPLCELILRHHDPTMMYDTRVSRQQKVLCAICSISVNIHSRLRYGRESSEWALHGEPALGLFALSDEDYLELEADLIEDYRMQFPG